MLEIYQLKLSSIFIKLSMEYKSPKNKTTVETLIVINPDTLYVRNLAPVKKTCKRIVAYTRAVHTFPCQPAEWTLPLNLHLI